MDSDPNGGMYRTQLQKFITMSPQDLSSQPTNESLSIAQVQQAVRWMLNRLSQLEPQSRQS